MANKWIHCNFCGRLPDGSRYFLSNCGHIACEYCVKSKEVLNPGCPLCKTTSTLIELNSQINEELKSFFTDPTETMKKYINEIKKVALFQTKNRQRLNIYKDNKIYRLTKYAEAYKKEHSSAKKSKENK